MRPTSLFKAHNFSSHKFLPQLVHASDRVRAFLLCLEPGQALPPRPDSEELLCYLIEGRAKLTIGDEAFQTSAGDLAAAAPGEVRGIEAEDRTVALWVHMAAQGRADG